MLHIHQIIYQCEAARVGASQVCTGLHLWMSIVLGIHQRQPEFGCASLKLAPLKCEGSSTYVIQLSLPMCFLTLSDSWCVKQAQQRGVWLSAPSR